MKRGRAASGKPLPKAWLLGCTGPSARYSPKATPCSSPPPRPHGCTREEKKHTGRGSSLSKGPTAPTGPVACPAHPPTPLVSPSATTAPAEEEELATAPLGASEGPDYSEVPTLVSSPPLWHSLGLLAHPAAAVTAGEVGRGHKLQQGSLTWRASPSLSSWQRSLRKPATHSMRRLPQWPDQHSGALLSIGHGTTSGCPLV